MRQVGHDFPLASRGRVRPKSNIGSALADLKQGACQWRIWSTLAYLDVRGRYNRSSLGQLWLTLSMGVTVAALGVIYGALFELNTAAFLPYIAMSFLAWGFVASLINESCTAFIQSEAYIRNIPLPRSVFIFRMVVRNAIVLAHNLVIAALVIAVFGSPAIWVAPLFLLGVAITAANAIWLALVLGILSARYRDLPQAVSSLVQLAFFVSPVIWKPEQLSARMPWLTAWNPLASFLEVMREPLLGQVPSAWAWSSCIIITLAGYAVALPFFARFRNRVAFYL